MKELAIIGGGASGIMAACVAARYSREIGANPGIRITLYEATDKIGRPILRSGNGRCNFSNSRIDASLYTNGKFVTEALSALDAALPSDGYPNPVVRFFSEYGVLWREEGDGRLYPKANKSNVILDVMRRSLDLFGVQIVCDTPIASIDESGSGASRFAMHAQDGRIIRPDTVIVATGGMASDGILLPFLPNTPLNPVLGPVAVAERWVKSLDNIRIRCQVQLVGTGGAVKARETGEVMFRKYGVSGICVFNLSRFMQPGDCLFLDLLPEVSAKDFASFIDSRAKMLGNALMRTPTNSDMLEGLVLGPVAEVLLDISGLDAEAPYKSGCADTYCNMLKSLALTCKGIGDRFVCQVAQGGYSVDAMDAATLAVKGYEGLYITGEALDVDAPCGGYNLHWAFATGLLAARAAVDGLAAGGVSQC